MGCRWTFARAVLAPAPISAIFSHLDNSWVRGKVLLFIKNSAFFYENLVLFICLFFIFGLLFQPFDFFRLIVSAFRTEPSRLPFKKHMKPQWFRIWKKNLYVYVSVLYVRVCKNSRSRNFYPIATKLDTKVSLVKIRDKFQDRLCGSHEGRMTFNKILINLIKVVTLGGWIKYIIFWTFILWKINVLRLVILLFEIYHLHLHCVP